MVLGPCPGARGAAHREGMTTTDVRGTIAVGYDGRPHSDVALEWAVHHAATVHRPVTIVHASGLPPGYTGTADGATLTANRQDIRQRGQAVLAVGRDLATQVDARVRVQEQLVVGEPREVLAEVAAAGAHLLVLGTHGHGRVVAYLLGSVSEAASVASACPLVVAREHEVPDRHSDYFDAVVVGLDGTEESDAVLDEAFGMASFLGRPLAVLHASDDTARWLDPGERRLRDETEEERRLGVSEALAGFAERFPDVPVSLHHVESDPRWALVDASRHAHLTAVGSRGRGDTTALVRGSVSRYVLEHAHGPVLVARHR